MNKQDYDDLLDTSLKELPSEIQPPRDLWTDIDHAIKLRESKDKSPVNKFFRAAVVAVVIVGGAWLFSSILVSNNATTNEVSLAMLVENMDKGFITQKANMLAVYKGQPSLTSNWQDHLQELEVARNGIREALTMSPNNIYMIQILQNIQQQQLDLIKSVHTQINRNI